MILMRYEVMKHNHSFGDFAAIAESLGFSIWVLSILFKPSFKLYTFVTCCAVVHSGCCTTLFIHIVNRLPKSSL